MTQRDPAKQLAKELADLRKEVRSGSSSSQMRFRAIEGGAIPVYNSDGDQTGSVGLLPDGTTGFQVIDGPKPVAPSAPILFPLIGGLEITWNGETFNGSALPGDFRCVEIHASPYSVYTPDETTLRASLIAAGTFSLQLPSQPWTVVFVIRTTANVYSDPSLGATETPAHAPTAAEVDAARSAAASAAQAAADANAKALQAAGIANGKGTVYTQATAPGADANGLWIDTAHGNLPNRWSGTTWVPVQDAGIQTAANAAAAAQSRADSAWTKAGTAQTSADNAMTAANTAQTAANGKNRVFWRPAASTPPAPLIDGDLWFKTDLGNQPFKYVAASSSWVAATFGDNAIAGLNVGKLTSGQIAVGQRIIAGLSTGTHAEMSDAGFKVYANDPAGGAPSVVVQMGTTTDDFFSVTSRTGQLLASIDSTGDGNFQGLNAASLAIGGRDLSAIISDVGRGAIGYFEGVVPGQPGQGGNYGPIQDRVGVAEVNGYLTAGRRYRLSARYTWSIYGITAADVSEHRAQFTYTGPASAGADSASGAPLVTSPLIDQQVFPIINPTSWQGQNFETTFTPTTTGRHRFLFSVERGATTNVAANVYIIGNPKVILRIEDQGPATQNAGALTQGGGAFYQGAPPPPPPPPTQSYYVDLGPSGRASWSGSGGLIGQGTNDVYQGYESYNGNTRGMFWFDPPAITGTVDRVDVYMYFRHWWFNSGGRVLMNLSDQRATAEGGNFFKFMGDWEPNVTVPKPGSMTVTLPSDWWPKFRGTSNANYSGRATCITIGPGPGTNQTYYGVATDCRLRIWYTQ